MQDVNQQAEQPAEADEQDKQVPALGRKRIKKFLPGLHCKLLWTAPGGGGLVL